MNRKEAREQARGMAKRQNMTLAEASRMVREWDAEDAIVDPVLAAAEDALLSQLDDEWQAVDQGEGDRVCTEHGVVDHVYLGVERETETRIEVVEYWACRDCALEHRSVTYRAGDRWSLDVVELG